MLAAKLGAFSDNHGLANQSATMEIAIKKDKKTVQIEEWIAIYNLHIRTLQEEQQNTQAAHSTLNNAKSLLDNIDNPINQAIIAAEIAVLGLPAPETQIAFTNALYEKATDILSNIGNQRAIFAIVNRIADIFGNVISTSIRKAIAIASFSNEAEFKSATRNIFYSAGSAHDRANWEKETVLYGCGFEPMRGTWNAEYGLKKYSAFLTAENIRVILPASGFPPFLVDELLRKAPFANAEEATEVFLSLMNNYEALSIHAKATEDFSQVSTSAGTFVFPINNIIFINVEAFESTIDSIASLPESVKKGIKVRNTATPFNNKNELIQAVQETLDAHALVCKAIVEATRISVLEGQNVAKYLAGCVEAGQSPEVIRDWMFRINDTEGTLSEAIKTVTQVYLSKILQISSCIERARFNEMSAIDRTAAKIITTKHMPDNVKIAAATAASDAMALWGAVFVAVNIYGRDKVVEIASLPSATSGNQFIPGANALETLIALEKFVNNVENFRPEDNIEEEIAEIEIAIDTAKESLSIVQEHLLAKQQSVTSQNRATI